MKTAHNILNKLSLPIEFESLLDSGRVLYVLGSPLTWASFPIGPHRLVVKELIKEGIKIKPEVKVIFEINKKFHNSEKKYILDHIGHTLLYLLHPKTDNECYNAQLLIKKYGIILK